MGVKNKKIQGEISGKIQWGGTKVDKLAECELDFEGKKVDIGCGNHEQDSEGEKADIGCDNFGNRNNLNETKACKKSMQVCEKTRV